MMYALFRNPELANKETSGMSLAPSAGTPGADCQDGFGYPPEQLDGLAPSDEMQLLLPPPPPVTSTRPGVCESIRALLQLASGVLPYFRTTKILFVHILFHVLSGT